LHFAFLFLGSLFLIFAVLAEPIFFWNFIKANAFGMDLRIAALAQHQRSSIVLLTSAKIKSGAKKCLERSHSGEHKIRTVFNQNSFETSNQSISYLAALVAVIIVFFFRIFGVGISGGHSMGFFHGFSKVFFQLSRVLSEREK
jgi:pheromone shutdown protein TraB